MVINFGSKFLTILLQHIHSVYTLKQRPKKYNRIQNNFGYNCGYFWKIFTIPYMECIGWLLSICADIFTFLYKLEENKSSSPLSLNFFFKRQIPQFINKSTCLMCSGRSVKNDWKTKLFLCDFIIKLVHFKSLVNIVLSIRKQNLFRWFNNRSILYCPRV